MDSCSRQPNAVFDATAAILKRELSMKTSCIRHGQSEVGVIEHEGQEYSALGATVHGRSVTGYTKLVDGEIHLSSWCGKSILASRSEVVERFWSGSLALIFRLSRGRFVVGFALDDDGMLFRGELLTGCDESDARRHALMLSDCFAQLDAEDEESFAAEQADE